MCAPTPPAPADPTVVANAQTQSNIATANNNAQLNRVNQYTPYGNLTYDQSGSYADGTPQWNANISLSPQEQELFNNQTQGQANLGNIALGMQNQVGSSYSSPINTSGLPGLTSTVNNGSFSPQAIQDAEDAAYKSQTQYLDPQYDQKQKSLDNSLINQGITQGSEAYNNAETLFNNQKQQAYGNAGYQAVQAGQNEQNVQFGQGVQASDLQNQSNQQGLTNIFALRNQPLNEYNSLMTGAQVQSPNFVSVPGATQAGTDVAGIYNNNYNQKMSAYNASQAGMNNLFSLGGSLGAAAIMAPSDRRLKRDIQRIGETSGGLPLYEFAYIWDGVGAQRHIGVMADEVAPVIPEAVHYDDDGFAMVDYARIK